MSGILDTIPSLEPPVDSLTTETGQLNVDDVSQLATVLATSRVHAAETPLAQLLLNHLSVPARRRPPTAAAPVDLENFGPLTPDEDEQSYQQFLAGIRSVSLFSFHLFCSFIFCDQFVHNLRLYHFIFCKCIEGRCWKQHNCNWVVIVFVIMARMTSY